MNTPTVAEAIEFAKIARSDCTNLVTFVVLQETGMLAAYLVAPPLTGHTKPPPDEKQTQETHQKESESEDQ